MNKTEIENELLRYFLDCLEKGVDCSIEVLFNQLENVDKNLFERTADELVRNGLLSGLKHNTFAKITDWGINQVEKRQLISVEKLQRNYQIRYEILEVAYKKYSSIGYGELASYEDFNPEHNFNRAELEFNLHYLEGFGRIKLDVNFVGDYSFYIEKLGVMEFKKWQKKPPFAAYFNKTTNPNPQSLEENFSKSELSTTMQSQADPKKVFVVHGRNEALRRSMFEFLRSIGLEPIEWSEAIQLTGKGSPYVGDVLDTAFSVAQAIVVLMTPDDEARLIESYRGSKEPNYETELTPQPRQNVLIEAGMALGRHPDRTILVEIGDLRPISDIVGRHIVRLNNSVGKRQDIVDRLETAECDVNIKGKRDWHTVGNFELQPTSKKEIETQQKIEQISQIEKLSEENVKILELLNRNPDSSVGIMSVDIADNIRVPIGKTKYLLDILEERNFVNADHYRNGESEYFISKIGRKYLYENTQD